MNKLIFDIGCNYGSFVAACLRKYGLDTDIVAVDANREVLDSWGSSVATGIVKVNAVVSENPQGEVPFFISPETGISTASEKANFLRGSNHM